jgi:hypothetical protein
MVEQFPRISLRCIRATGNGSSHPSAVVSGSLVGVKGGWHVSNACVGLRCANPTYGRLISFYLSVSVVGV